MIEAPLEEYGTYDGVCAGCDDYARIDDVGLCEGCAGKLERDLIRNRDWACSVTAYAMSNEEREKLHRQVVRRYGKAHELMVPTKGDRKNGRKKRDSGKPKRKSS